MIFKFVAKMLALLSPPERNRLYLLFGAMIIMAVIEVASVGSIVPFMTVVTNPDIVLSHKWLGMIYEHFNFESPNAFLIVLGIVVLLTLVVSNTSTALITWWIFKYSWNRNHSIAMRLFASYLEKPYIFFLNRNTSELEKNILDEVQLVIIGVLNSLLMMFKSTIVICFVVILLIAMDPLLALFVSVTLGGAYFLLFHFSSKILRRIGWERAEANIKRFKFVSEALSGIKVLRVLGREKHFLAQFAIHSAKVSETFAQKSVIAQLPRYAFEVVAFGGVLLIIIYFLAKDKNIDHIVPLLSLYAFAGYRLMPSMQTVFNKAANIRYVIPSLEILYNDLYQSQNLGSKQLPSNHKYEFDLKSAGIHLNDITFYYPEQKAPVLENLDLTIPPKNTIGIAGETGSGKTTIIDILLGLLKPTSGELVVGGVAVKSETIPQWQSMIGYVPQDIFLTDESVKHNIALGIPESEIEMDAVIRAANLAQIHHFITDELSAGYNTIVGERGVRLSGGQKQRIGIARALYHDPEVLILDEATSALDSATEESIIQAIRSLSHKKTIVMIAHRLTTLEECDEILVLKKGSIIDRGRYEQLVRTCEYFKTIQNAEKSQLEV